MRLARVQPVKHPAVAPAVALELGDGYLLLEASCGLLGKEVPWATSGDDPTLSFLQVGGRAWGVARECLENADALKAAPEAFVPPEQVKLLLPFRPLSLRDFMAWEAHYVAASRTMVRRYLPRPMAWAQRLAEALGSRRAIRPKALWHRQPIYYKGNPLSFVGPDEEIRWPPGVRDLDFELEIGFVLRESVCNALPQQAEQAIAAYTIFNDFSARDLQIAEMQSGMGPAKCKDFDTGNAMGPVLVTPDEIPALDELRCRVSVNGNVWADTTTAGMRWRPCDMIAYASRGETLYAGEFFATGTVAGCSGVELDRWLQPGDVLELEVERIGTLRNRIGPRA